MRDVKRQSEQRREREKMKRGPDDDQERDLQEVALKVSSTDSEVFALCCLLCLSAGNLTIHNCVMMVYYW